MKKLICAAAVLLLTASAAFADRKFEVGLDLDVQADETLMPLKDIFVEELVIDLPKIADSMGSEGFVLDTQLEPKFYANVNTANFGVGGVFSIDGYAKVGIGKEFWEILAYGNELDEESVVDVNAGVELYAQLEAPVRFKVKKFNIRVTPSVFAPIVYVPNPDAKITVETDSDGTLKATGSAQYSVYSIFNLQNVVSVSEDGTYSLNDITMDSLCGDSSLLPLMMSSVGFDLDGEVTYPLFSWMSVGGYAHIPLIPGRLNNSISGSVSASGEVDAVLNSLTNGEGLSTTIDGPTISDVVFGSDTYTVNRPLRIGAMANLSIPGVSNLLFTPKIGFSTRNPFGQDYDFMENSSFEYALTVNYDVLNILKFYLSTERWNNVYSNYLGMALNVRVAQIGLTVGTSGATFVDSFSIYGLKGKLDICFGF